jgi:hypothetical protein
MSNAGQIYCPECGTANPLEARTCRTCGAPLPSPQEREQLWSTRTVAPGASSAHVTAESAPARRRGPNGCILGCLGLLLILAVAAALGYFAVLPAAREAARDQLRDVVSTQVVRIDTLPVLPSGELVITEEDVNRRLRENIGEVNQISDPVFNINPDGVTLTVDVLGTETTYRGGVAVEDGRIVITNPEADGPAGQVLPADDVADFVEDLVNDLQRRSTVEFTGVQLSDGQMTIETTRSGTPAEMVSRS